MSRRLNWMGLALLTLVISLTGCGINNQQLVTEVVTPDLPPTVTLAPVITSTPRYTATLIPSSTGAPSQTFVASDTPAPLTDTPAASPTAFTAIVGSVNPAQTLVNMRAGADTTFDVVKKLKGGTDLSILSANDTRDWYFVREPGGMLGWIQSRYIITANPTAIGVLQPSDLTQVALVTPNPSTGALTPTLAARSPLGTDILAYCDNPDIRGSGRTYSKSASLTVYWEWEAQTPEQVADQIDNGQYEVRLDNKVLDTWANYRTAVRKGGSTKFPWQVYWYVPIGKLDAGAHKIDYKLTWKAKITDGVKTYGPGGDDESDVGSCDFNVK